VHSSKIQTAKIQLKYYMQTLKQRF
jgi:hypothetical protein